MSTSCDNCKIVELAAARFGGQARRPTVRKVVQLCPLHEAAPALRAALENTARLLIAIQSRYHGDYVGHCAGCAELPCWIDHAHEQARDAIAQTKGE